MKVLVTGANGFIGKNLCLTLETLKYEVLKYDLNNTEDELAIMVNECDFIMHLAGINRPLTTEEFYNGNTNFTLKIIDLIKKSGRKIPLLLSSSIQATRDNDYGKSKRMAEDLVLSYGKDTHSDVFVFRLANAFGKWCRPNYNSVVATFCHNIANDLPIQVNSREAIIPFVYIDDICNSFISCIGKTNDRDYYYVEPVYERSLGELVDLLNEFKNSRKTLSVANMNDGFAKKLYSTYLSYLPENAFSYELKMNVDNRGSFTEMIRTDGQGQFSVNISKPGIVKGNHWHHTKNEKFLVVKGNGVIRFRKINEEKVIEYYVSGDKLEVVDIPCGYTHNIENLGEDDMVTVMWANEPFDPNNPDTFYEKV